MPKIINIDLERKTVFYRTFDKLNPFYALEMDLADFFKLRMGLVKKYEKDKNPYNRVGNWECRVDGIFNYEKWKSLLTVRNNGKDPLDEMIDEVKELKKEIQDEISKRRKG